MYLEHRPHGRSFELLADENNAPVICSMQSALLYFETFDLVGEEVCCERILT